MKTTSKFGGALSKLRGASEPTEEPEVSGIQENPKSDTTAPPQQHDVTSPDFGNPGIQENMTSGGPVREKYSTYIDGDLVTRVKVLAARTRRKHHQIVEEALREYLARHDPQD